jgi:hypothetical protein
MCLWASDSKPWSSCGRHERSAQHAYKPIRRRKVVHSWGELIKTSHMTRSTVPPRVSSTSATLRYVAARRHLFIGLSVDQSELSRIYEEEHFTRGTALPARQPQ